jgi:hypothetical protein
MKEWIGRISFWVVVYIISWILASQDEDRARWWYYYHAGCYKLAELVGREGMKAELRYKAYVL